MRVVPQRLLDVWKSGHYVGEDKPMQRASVQVINVQHPSTTRGRFGNALFNQAGRPMELPNIRSISIDRRVGTPVATCTIELANTAAPDAALDTLIYGTELELPGWYTPNRGTDLVGEAYKNRWGRTENEWSNVLLPNRMIRTYWGYGHDPDVTPDRDPNLVQSGVWLIDRVILTAKKTIRVECRDLAKILVESIAFPPVIPLEDYPLRFKSQRQADAETAAAAGGVLPTSPGTTADSDPKPPAAPVGVPGKPSTTTEVVKLQYRTSSNFVYYQNGPVHGHRGVDAFDGNPGSFWLSIGNPTRSGGASYEYIEAQLPAQSLNGIRFTPWKGHYKAFVSVYTRGVGWRGAATIPYDRNHPNAFQPGGNGADIKYVTLFSVGSHDQQMDVNFSQTFEEVERVRITFTDLADSGISPKWRAGVREFVGLRLKTVQPPAAPPPPPNVVTPPTVGGPGGGVPGGKVEPGKKQGDYVDYTDIVKKLCAIGGFYWPRNAQNWRGDSAGPAYSASNPNPLHYEAQPVAFVKDDPVLSVGRVWGDFELAGTSGPTELGPSIFDKKPLMDGITYVKDILGYIFFVDESGGVVFRSPNIWSVGNWVQTLNANGDPEVEPPPPPVDDPDVELDPAPDPGAIPKGFVLRDPFDRPDSDGLQQAGTGQKWVQGGFTRFGIRGTKATYQGVGVPNDAATAAYALADIGNLDQNARWAVITRDPQPGNRKGRLLLRAKKVLNNLSAIQVRLDHGATPTTGRIVVQKIVNNVFSDIFIGPENVPFPTNAFDYRVELVGNTLRVFRDPIGFDAPNNMTSGTLVAQVIDEALTDPAFGTFVGFRSTDASVAYENVYAEPFGYTTTNFLFVKDTFTRPDDEYLRRTETGQRWYQGGAAFGAGAKWSVKGGEALPVYGTATQYGPPAVSGLWALTDLDTLNQDVKVRTQFIVLNQNRVCSVGVRMRGTQYGIMAQITAEAGTRNGVLKVFSIDEGSYVEEANVPLTGVLSPNWVQRVSCVGDTVRVYVNQTLVYEEADADYAGTDLGGQCGFQATGPNHRMDDFYAYVLPYVDPNLAPPVDLAGAPPPDPIGNVPGRKPGYVKNEVPVIDEREVLREITVNIDDRNQRSAIFVGNGAGTVGAAAIGFEPFPAGIERVLLYTDQHFEGDDAQAEVQQMADLIAVRTVFSYRTDVITIPGAPHLQIDDQVRIYERETGESFIHYINGITSQWDAESGVWTFQLSTHWLGEKPFEKWAFDPAKLSQATQEFLAGIGRITK